MKKPVKKSAAKKPARKAATKVTPKKAAKKAAAPKADKPKSAAAKSAVAKNVASAREAEATRLKRKEKLTLEERKRLLELAPRRADTRWPSEIEVGNRHRKEFGDITLLARSFNARNGMLSRIAIDERLTKGQDLLIAGERRLRAWLHPTCKFRDQPIPVNAVPIDSVIAGEWDENDPDLRKNFTPTEMVALKQAMEPRLKEAAAARSRAGRAVEQGTAKGRAGDIAGKMAGKSRRTVEKAEKIVQAAKERPDDPKYQKLVTDMDRTGNVNGPFKRLEILTKTAELRAAPAPLPMCGPYAGMIIDYPWPNEPGMSQEEIDERARSLRPYPAMAIEEGLKLFASDDFKKLLADKIVMGFCTTGYHMPYAYQMIQAMGFALTDCKTILVWDKVLIGRGQVLREVTEYVIIVTRGNPVINLTNETTLFSEKRRGNSVKPERLYELFETVYPAPRYADIFSGGGRGEKWDCHGEPGRMAAGDARAAAEAARQAVEIPAAEELVVLENFALGKRGGTNAAIAQCAGAGLIVTKGKRSITEAGKARLEGLRAAAGDDGSKFVNGNLLKALDRTERGLPVVWDDEVMREMRLCVKPLISGTKTVKLTPFGKVKLAELRAEAAALAALPSDIDELVDDYRATLRLRNAAAISPNAVDHARIAGFSDRLELLQRKANGGTSFGMACDESAAERLRAETAAPIGTMPMWGQRGMFELDVDGVPHIVKHDEDSGFEVHAADKSKPFLSETGFRCLWPFGKLVPGKAVDEVALELIRAEIDRPDGGTGKRSRRTKRNPMVLPEHQYRLPTSWAEAVDGDPIRDDFMPPAAEPPPAAAATAKNVATSPDDLTDPPVPLTGTSIEATDPEPADAAPAANDDGLEISAFLRREKGAA